MTSICKIPGWWNLLCCHFRSSAHYAWSISMHLYTLPELYSFNSRLEKSKQAGYDRVLDPDAQSGKAELLVNRKRVPCRGLGYPVDAPIHWRNIISSQNGPQLLQVEAYIPWSEWKDSEIESLLKWVRLWGPTSPGTGRPNTWCFIKIATLIKCSRLCPSRWEKP